MEKEGARGHYRAYEGLKANNNGNTSSLKRCERGRTTTTHPSRQVRCLCFGGVPDKASHHSFLKGCVINLGICALLVAYTLLGSFIFLAIEGGGAEQQRSTTSLVATMPATASGRRNATAWLKQVRRSISLSFPIFHRRCVFTIRLVSIFVARNDRADAFFHRYLTD